MFRLIDSTTSLARFGDGELLSMLLPGYHLYFQRTTFELGAELRSIWTMQNLDADSLVWGFPDLSKGPYTSDVWANERQGWRGCARRRALRVPGKTALLSETDDPRMPQAAC